MDGDYDEDIRQNHFFLQLKKHQALLENAIREGWVICIPRRGSFLKETLDEQDANAHILQPVSTTVGYRSLSNNEVELENKLITVKKGTEVICTTYLYFEETFYDEGLCKYRVWCIDRPLLPDTAPEHPPVRVTVVTNLQEAATFLWTEVSEKKLLKELTSMIESFEDSNADLNEKSIDEQADLTAALYSRCMSTLLKDATVKSLCSSSQHFYKTLKLSVETYLLYAIRGTLRRSVSAVTALTDAGLNKILRNSSDLELNDLDVRSDLRDRVHTAKLKLSRLDRFATVLGKTECLRRTVRCLSEGLPSISSDDLLPVLVYLVLKSSLSNWIAQVTFMKYFRFSAALVYEADEVGFLVTSLEAAVEHLRSGGSCYVSFDSSHESHDQLDFPSTVALAHDDRDQTRASLRRLICCIESGDLLEARKILSEGQNNSPTDISALCHPLCTCDKCRETLTHSNYLRSTLVQLKDEKGLTALHSAAHYGRKSIASLLLAREADVNATDNDGRTPLHHAAAKGHRDVVSLLLCMRADPIAGDLEKDTPLHLATENGQTDCVEVLLRLTIELHTESPRVDPNLVNLKGDTPLHRASKWGYEDIVKLLLEYDANPTVRNKSGQTPLTIAHSQRVAELLGGSAARRSSPCSSTGSDVSRFIESRNFQEKENAAGEEASDYSMSINERNMGKLFAAIIQGDTCLACFYLGLENQRKEIDTRTADLCHPLCNCERCASSDEFPKIRSSSGVRALAVNARNRAGETALHLASAFGSTDLVRILLDVGANVNLATELEHRTPLHLACLCDNPDVLKLLLNCATCELDTKDRNGDTALHIAVKTGNAKLVRLLVRYGANTEIRNAAGITPLQQLHEELKNDSVPSLPLVSISNILKRNSVENAPY